MSKVREEEALHIVYTNLARAYRPVLWCSFGKDSSVVLDMTLRMRKVPIVHIRNPKFHEKYQYVQRMAEFYDLEIYDLLPYRAEILQTETAFEILKYYSIGDGMNIPHAYGVKKHKLEDGRFYCAVDIMNGPQAPVTIYPWDVTFMGSKETDLKNIGIESKNMLPVVTFGATSTVSPLYNWTTEDVWEYIHKYNVPYDISRYDHGDDFHNPDTVNMCYACLDTNQRGEEVWCPKVKGMIPNVAPSVEENKAVKDKFCETIKFCEVV